MLLRSRAYSSNTSCSSGLSDSRSSLAVLALLPKLVFGSPVGFAIAEDRSRRSTGPMGRPFEAVVGIASSRQRY